MLSAHQHDNYRIVDPETGHEWEVCICGFAIDIHVLRGNTA